MAAAKQGSSSPRRIEEFRFFAKSCGGPIPPDRAGPRRPGSGRLPALRPGYFSRGWPGEAIESLCSFAVRRLRSASLLTADKRLRNWTIFSLRERRRRISGRRLGADMKAPVLCWRISAPQPTSAPSRSHHPFETDSAKTVNDPRRSRTRAGVIEPGGKTTSLIARGLNPCPAALRLGNVIPMVSWGRGAVRLGSAKRA